MKRKKEKMPFIRCERGHLYDPEKHTTCPMCGLPELKDVVSGPENTLNRDQEAAIRCAREFAAGMKDIFIDTSCQTEGPNFIELAVRELVMCMDAGGCSGGFRKEMLRVLQEPRTFIVNEGQYQSTPPEQKKQVTAENYCMGCMEEREQGAVCQHCGFLHDIAPASDLYLTPGTILQGKYMIGRVIGHGRFGITYIALDMNLHVKLAVKEYLPRNIAKRNPNNTIVMIFSEPYRENFENMLEILLDDVRRIAQLGDSSGIVSAYDFFRANGTAYFVMHFVEGIIFEEHLAQRGGEISFDQATRVLMPVMDSLNEMHQTNLLHRENVNPENIYIAKNGQGKLLSPATMKRFPISGTKSLTVELKLGFAPEEQYRSRGEQGPWSDIYSVGATFYRAITGILPPGAQDRLHMDTLQPPSQLGVAIPDHAEQALLKAMSVRASDRFQDIGTFQKALLGD